MAIYGIKQLLQVRGLQYRKIETSVEKLKVSGNVFNQDQTQSSDEVPQLFGTILGHIGFVIAELIKFSRKSSTTKELPISRKLIVKLVFKHGTNRFMGRKSCI